MGDSSMRLTTYSSGLCPCGEADSSPGAVPRPIFSVRHQKGNTAPGRSSQRSKANRRKETEMSAHMELSWVPEDAQNATLRPTGNDKIDAARDELYDKIDFLKSQGRFRDLAYLFKPGGSDAPDRTRIERYEQHGCKTHVSSYWRDHGRADYKWWSDVLVAVQDDPTDALDAHGELALFVDFHGGGFTSGDILHGAWRQKHKVEFTADHPVVCVCPNYPLMPWFTGADILRALDQFWQYVFSERFQADLNQLHPGLKVRLADIAVSGDSAGGWLAMYSYLQKFALRTGAPKQHLPIRVVFVQYPMLRHYKRTRPAAGYAYMEHGIPDDDHAEAGAALRTAWRTWRDVLAQENTSPYDVDILRPWAPLGVSASYLGSTYQDLWRDMFQDGDDTMLDIIGQLERTTPADAPAGDTSFFFYHGTDDNNCSIDDSRDAVALLQQHCGVSPANIYLHEVGGEKHGFDHHMSVREEPFLRDVYAKVAARLFS